MRNHAGTLVGMDDMGDFVLDLLSESPPPPTTTGRECDVLRFFSDEDGIIPL
jgi:hypothetical protein